MEYLISDFDHFLDNLRVASKEYDEMYSWILDVEEYLSEESFEKMCEKIGYPPL